eukprot:TRINITY_DN20463_c0_g3_i1.p3 TRINITY_DN20463_c0_g3~~TRINITY_DN20463_c0_g3_i1.p3  ORF type:complete len:148 (-),score=24.46 TRINITY_DN20463_c0_g3_i1:151-594(-)
MALRRAARGLPQLYNALEGTLQTSVRYGGGGGGDDKYKWHRHPLEPPRADELERIKLINTWPFYFGNPYPQIPGEDIWKDYPDKYPTITELCMMAWCAVVVYYTARELYLYGLFGMPPENPLTRFVYEGEPYYNQHTKGPDGQGGHH